jgi:cytochrome c-type biogenesis protein CcmH/NrfG
LAWACHVNGDKADAIEAIQEAIKLEPGNIEYKQMYEDFKKGN